MAVYEYEASNRDGQLVSGELEAVDREFVVEYLQRKELIPVTIKPRIRADSKTGLAIHVFERITPLDRIVLVRDLAATTKAGLSLVEALDILIDDTSKGLVKRVLTQAKVTVQNGQPLSQAFEQYKQYFPAFFVGMLRAAEASGKLDVTLQELSDYMSREYELVRKVRGALAYPVILLVGSVGIVGLMMGFVLPRIQRMFTQSNIPLPFITKVLIGVSSVVTYSFVLDIVVVAGVAWFFIFFRRTSIGRRLFTAILFRTPVAKELLKKVALVRFTRTLASMLSSGSTIQQAMTLSAESAGNEYYKQAIVTASGMIAKGLPLSKSLAHHPALFPRFLTSLIAVGERTGSLEYVLKTFANFYDEEVDHTLKNLATFLEPLLLLTMGVVIGTIALSILLPIFRFVGSFV